MELTENQTKQLIVNKIINSPQYLPLIVNHFDIRHYDNDSNGIILKLITSYYDKYKKIPSNNLLNNIIDKYCEKKELDNKSIKLNLQNALSNQYEDNDEKFIQDKILDFIKTKSMYFSIMDNLDRIEKNKNVSQCIEDFQKIEGIVLDDNIGFDYFNEEHQEKYWDKMMNPEAKIPTGYKQLDFITNGGFPRDDHSLSIIMAQPHMGKSMVLSNLAVNMLKQGSTVVLISLEMSELVYASRITAHITKNDINNLTYNKDRCSEKIYNFKNLHPEAKLIIKEYPPATINCNVLKSYLDKLKNQKINFNAVFVDYINLLVPNKNNGSGMYERIGEVTLELRALSYGYMCPFISATQCNREGYNTSDIDIENVSESTTIVMHADFIGALFQNDGDDEACRLNMKILKNRFGGRIGKKIEFMMNKMNLVLEDVSVKELEEEKDTEDIICELENL